MIRIMFVCHGNICRSPMAEFVLKDLVEKKGLREMFFISSSATSTEELGNPVHSGTKNKLREHGISTAGKYAVQLSKKDYEEYDYFIGMDDRNILNMQRIFGHDKDKKIHKLLDFCGTSKDIADPWYTGNFQLTYEDILEGCRSLLDFVLKKR